MMRRQMQHQELVFAFLEDLMPDQHFLEKIYYLISSDFIYDILSPYYLINGSPSVNPKCTMSTTDPEFGYIQYDSKRRIG